MSTPTQDQSSTSPGGPSSHVHPCALIGPKDLLWEGSLDDIHDLVDFRNRLRRFKETVGTSLLDPFIQDTPDGLMCFRPYIRHTGNVRNIGIYSTAVCLEAKSDFKDYPASRLATPLPYVKFVVGMLSGKDDFKPESLTVTSTLVHLGRYLDLPNQRDLKELIDNEPELCEGLERLLAMAIVRFEDRLKQQGFAIHPFEYYKFLQFIHLWRKPLSRALCEAKEELLKPESGLKAHLGDSLPGKISDDVEKKLLEYFDLKLYDFAKYELYRQISLHHSRDLALYDAKRLIYSLLTVYTAGRFSNHLVREKSLDLIFESQRTDTSSLLPTGELVPISFDSRIAITSIQCLVDLLDCPHLFEALEKHLLELKVIFDVHARMLREGRNGVRGWHPPDQRDREPVSWFTALVLRFIRLYCLLINRRIENLAKNNFRSNYKEPHIDWHELHDSSGAKAKLELMVHRSALRFAILFGPPGTGKTSLARALANRLRVSYLELTPADFFSVTETSFASRINEIFETLQHLQNTLVFVDEVDDLVRERTSGYDPRSFFVHVLLPRFQELRDSENIYLILATNRFDQVDEAIQRRGRFDLTIPVAGLSVHGRLGYLTSKKPKALEYSKENIQKLVTFAEHTENFSFKLLEALLRSERFNWDCSPAELERTLLEFVKLTQEPHDLEDFVEDLPLLRDRLRPALCEGDFLGFHRVKLSFGEHYLSDEDKRNFVKTFLLVTAAKGPSDKLSKRKRERISSTVKMLCDKKYYGLVIPFSEGLDRLGMTEEVGWIRDLESHRLGL